MFATQVKTSRTHPQNQQSTLLGKCPRYPASTPPSSPQYLSFERHQARSQHLRHGIRHPALRVSFHEDPISTRRVNHLLLCPAQETTGERRHPVPHTKHPLFSNLQTLGGENRDLCRAGRPPHSSPCPPKKGGEKERKRFLQMYFVRFRKKKPSWCFYTSHSSPFQGVGVHVGENSGEETKN